MIFIFAWGMHGDTIFTKKAIKSGALDMTFPKFLCLSPREKEQSSDAVPPPPKGFLSSLKRFSPEKNKSHENKSETSALFSEVILDHHTMISPSEQKKNKEIKILMLLWRGETDAERGFIEELSALDYKTLITAINVDCSPKYLKQVLYNELHPEDYDYIYTFGTLASLITTEWANDVTPVIFNVVSYPVQTGLIARNEGHNGGNLSGVATSAPMSVQISNAKAIFPIKHLIVLINPKEQNCFDSFEALQEVAKSADITLSRVDMSDENEIVTKLSEIKEEKHLSDGAIYVTSSSFFTENGKLIFDYGRSEKIPIIAEQMDMVVHGALMGTAAYYESSGRMAAKILDMNYNFNVPIAAIPVQFPEFFCSINKDTAKILGIKADGLGFKIHWVEDENKNGADSSQCQ